MRSLGESAGAGPHFFLPVTPGDRAGRLSSAVVWRGELGGLEVPGTSQDVRRFSLPRTLAAWEATVLTLILSPSRPSFCSSLSMRPVTNLEVSTMRGEERLSDIGFRNDFKKISNN